MSKFLFILLLLFYSISYATPPVVDSKGKLMPVITEIDSAVVGNTKQIGDFSEFGTGLTFAKFFIPGADINANYAKGSPIGNFTVSRSASAPATYIDNNGTIQLLTTSNTMRSDNRGYYNETGWHLQSGMTMEGASTNLLNRTDGTASGSGLWTGWESFFSTDETPTLSQVSIPELSGISGSYSQRVAVTLGGTQASKYARIKSTVTAQGSVTTGTAILCSVWARTQTANDGNFNLHISEFDGNGVWMPSQDKNGDFITLTNDWRRYLYNVTLTANVDSISKFEDSPTAPGVRTKLTSSTHGNTAGSLVTISATTNYNGTYTISNVSTNTYEIVKVFSTDDATGTATCTPTCFTFEPGNKLLNNGDVVDYEIALPQVEKSFYPSSWIPTTTTNLTRPAESLSFSSVNNFPAPYGNDCESFNGVNSTISFGNLGNISNVEFRIQSRVANQQIFTVDNSTTGAVTVVGGVLTFGANLTATNITVDGVSKTATQAGALINDLSYHVVNFDLTEIPAPSFTFGFDGSAYGDYFIQYIKTTGHSWTFDKQLLTDSIGANNGTANQCTWSKDKHDFTILLAYAPTMLPNEQDGSNKDLFALNFDASSNIYRLRYNSNANDCIGLVWRSNAVSYDVFSANGSLSAWNRNSPQIIGVASSLTPDSNNKQVNIYNNGSSIASSASKAIPAGSLPSSFSILSGSGQSMQLGALLIWNRRLDANEFKTATNLVKEYLKWN